MNIGEVIRKHRKGIGLTQEEMARRLGVTAPAVNKWESGSTMPDIMLLAPIARLLKVSLDELLSFREEPSEEELRALVQEADRRLTEEPYEAAFQWARTQMERYPNSERLILSLSVMLDAQRLMNHAADTEQYDELILAGYERLLKSADEEIRHGAADALYGYHLRRENLAGAEAALAYFSKENPEKKRKQAFLCEKAGRTAEAYRAYEELLFSGFQGMDAAFNSLCCMKLAEKDIAGARALLEKRKEFIAAFDMGAYRAEAAELEILQAEQDESNTLALVEQMLRHVESMRDFTVSPLYAHMTFKPLDPAWFEHMKRVKRQIASGLLEDEGFAYMRDDPRWTAMLDEACSSD